MAGAGADDGDHMILSGSEASDLDEFIEGLHYLGGGRHHDDDDDGEWFASEEGGTEERDDDDDEEEEDDVPRRGRKKGKGRGIIKWKDDGKLIGTVDSSKSSMKVFRESLTYKIKFVRNNRYGAVYKCVSHSGCTLQIGQFKVGDSAQYWQVICVGAPPHKSFPTLHPARLRTSRHWGDQSSLRGWMPRQRGRLGGCHSETLHVSSSLKT